MTPPSRLSATVASGAGAERRVLLRALAVALAVHATAAILFRSPPPPRPSKTASPHQFRLALAAGEEPLAQLFDPSLLALPSARGFSLTALISPLLTPPPRPQWRAQAETLPNLHAEPRGHSVATEPTVQERLAAGFDRLKPMSLEEPLTEAPGAAGGTMFQIVAEGWQRELFSEPDATGLAGGAPLRPTTLRIGVNGAGAVVSALLEKSSGNESADERGLREVVRWHFAARPDAAAGELDWLEVTIHWGSEVKP